MRSLLGLCLTVLAFSACNTPPPSPPDTNDACPATITIGPGNNYSPSSCSLSVGQSVTIQAFGSHPLTGSGAGKTVTSTVKDQTIGFTAAGTFSYKCDVHGGFGMTGTITVKP